jgi:uncharacterized protein (DUF2236 family)
LVSESDLEAALDAVQARAAGSVEGIFGPASMTWRIDRESVIFLGAGRALLLQLAHPWVATAVAEHSRTFADPIGRFHRTFDVVFTMVFGSLDSALAAARHLHHRHATIVGRLTEAIGSFESGSSYCANEAAALRWVHATLVETALIVHDLILPPLSVEERERYWAESRLFGALFGLTSADLPADWESFAAYNAVMMQSDLLSVSAAAREVAGQIFAGSRPWLRPPRWYQALSAQLLPDHLRMGFGFAFDERETGKPQKVRSHVYDSCIPKYRLAFGTSVPTMKLKRDYKESRSLAGRPDVLTGPGSDGPSWMTAGTGKALSDAIFAALHAVRQRCFGRLQFSPPLAQADLSN